MTPSSSESSVSISTAKQAGGLQRHEQEWLSRSSRRGLAFAESLARRRPFWFAASLVTLLFALVIVLLPPAFQTNDDAIMCMIASGEGIALSPDEHLVFTNAVIGGMLKTLYTVCPAFHWYGWYLVATQWIATVAILYCLLRPRYSRRSMLGFGAYFLTSGIYFLVNLQFTATGILAGITGGLLLIQLLRYNWPTRREQAALALSGVLFLVWGGMIRSDIFPLAMVIVCPVLAVTYWASSARRSMAVKAGLSLAAAAGLMFLAAQYHDDCYSDPSWQAFYQYNPLRVKFNDEMWVNYQPDNRHVFEQVGWSKTDFEMINGWYYDDPQYDQETLSKILNGYGWALERNYLRTLKTALKDMLRTRTFVAMLFVMPPMMLFLHWRERRFWTFVVAFLSAWGIVLAITLLRKAAPERVFMPVLAFPCLVTLFAVAPGWRGCRSQRRAISRLLQECRIAWQVRHWSWLKPNAGRHLLMRTISLLIVVGMVMSIRKQCRNGSQHVRQLAHHKKLLDEMRPEAGEPERLVLAFGADFPYEYQAALFGNNDYSRLRFFSVGWPQRTPIAERMKKHFQIEHLGQALATRPELKLILHSSAHFRLISYLEQHYGKPLQIMHENDDYYSVLTSVQKRVPMADLQADENNTSWLAFPYLKKLGLFR